MLAGKVNHTSFTSGLHFKRRILLVICLEYPDSFQRRPLYLHIYIKGGLYIRKYGTEIYMYSTCTKCDRAPSGTYLGNLTMSYNNHWTSSYFSQ